jgi:hypothetical protein
MTREDENRVFVRNGRRHFRRTYSQTEVRIGLVILLLLAVIVVWVAWRGAHPDPELYQTGILESGGEVADRTDPSGGIPGGGAGRAPSERASDIRSRVDRGPLPEALAASGWAEGTVSRFGAENLYEKIDGREDYYKSFGFQHLFYVSLTRQQEPAAVIDIELFDLGRVENALGAYAGERSPRVAAEVDAGGLSHLDRNALFMARGPYYVRLIGSDESPEVREELARLRDVFRAALAGEELPGAYAVFVGGLGLDVGRVSFTAENAFSFGFARNVYSALLDDEETEVFFVAAPDPGEAQQLAGKFNGGFREYGEPVEGEASYPWVQDRYIQTVAVAVARGSWMIGVRGSPDVAAAEAAMKRLERAVEELGVRGGGRREENRPGGQRSGERPPQETRPEENR